MSFKPYKHDYSRIISLRRNERRKSLEKRLRQGMSDKQTHPVDDSGLEASRINPTEDSFSGSSNSSEFFGFDDTIVSAINLENKDNPNLDNTNKSSESQENILQNQSEEPNFPANPPINQNLIMAEQGTEHFAISVAHKLPEFSGAEKVETKIKEFLDAIEFYHDELVAADRPKLFKFITKVKLVGVAKIKFGSNTPDSFANFKTQLITTCGYGQTEKAVKLQMAGLKINKPGIEGLKSYYEELENLTGTLQAISLNRDGATSQREIENYQKRAQEEGITIFKKNLNKDLFGLLEAKAPRTLHEAYEIVSASDFIEKPQSSEISYASTYRQNNFRQNNQRVQFRGNGNNSGNFNRNSNRNFNNYNRNYNNQNNNNNGNQNFNNNPDNYNRGNNRRSNGRQFRGNGNNRTYYNNNRGSNNNNARTYVISDPQNSGNGQTVPQGATQTTQTYQAYQTYQPNQEYAMQTYQEYAPQTNQEYAMQPNQQYALQSNPFLTED